MLPVKRPSTYVDSKPGKRRRRSESISSSEDDSASDSSESLPGPSSDRNAPKRASSSRIAKELDIEEEDPDESEDEAEVEDNSKPSPSVRAPSASRLGLKPKGASHEPIKSVKDPSTEAASRIPPSRKPNITEFSALGVSAPLVSALGAMSIRRPTPVQAACIPELLAGKDCVGNAKTGQGKTVAFALPILQQLAKDPFGIFALVLTPTRELAFQIAAQFNVIGAPLDIRTTVVVGGMDMMSQMVSLNRRPHVVVATPGRLVDLLNESSGEWSLSRIKFLVLDEADRLLGTGFASELATIFSHVPADRQTGLFTATLTPTIEALALAPPRPGKSKPYVYRDSDTSEIETVETLKQQYILCPSHVRELYLYHLLCNPPEAILHLRRGSAEAERRKANLAKKQAKERRQNKYQIGLVSRKKKVTHDEDTPPHPPPTIIFVASSRTAAYLERLLKELEFEVTSLHSKLTQAQRLSSLNAFRAFEVPILVCTDVGARGLDMDGVGMVINWDLPRNPKGDASLAGNDIITTAEETYIHRVGRTARMGRGGVAISFVTERKWDEETVSKIENKIKIKLSELSFKEDAVLEKLHAVSSAKRVAIMEMEHSNFGKREERHKEVEEKGKGKWKR